MKVRILAILMSDLGKLMPGSELEVEDNRAQYWIAAGVAEEMGEDGVVVVVDEGNEDDDDLDGEGTDEGGDAETEGEDTTGAEDADAAVGAASAPAPRKRKFSPDEA